MPLPVPMFCPIKKVRSKRLLSPSRRHSLGYSHCLCCTQNCIGLITSAVVLAHKTKETSRKKKKKVNFFASNSDTLKHICIDSTGWRTWNFLFGTSMVTLSVSVVTILWSRLVTDWRSTDGLSICKGAQNASSLQKTWSKTMREKYYINTKSM